jgi:hypothetical protein
VDENLRNFRSSYLYVLELFYTMKDAGIATSLIPLSLLERYLRQKNHPAQRNRS